jgi:acyl transferase domain-containing protein
VIKMVLALRHGLLPRSLHIDQPSSHVEWTGGLRLLTEPVPWSGGDRPRRAGVSSFGISGTNAHVIVADPPPPPSDTADSQEPAGRPVLGTDGPVPWLISGGSVAAVEAQAARLAEHLGAGPDPVDVGWSLAAGRSRLAHRAVVLGRSAAELTSRLTALAAGDPAVPGVVTGSPIGQPGRTAFVFSGQGAHWVGMAVELIDSSPVFAQWIDRCGAALAPYVDWDLTAMLRGDSSRAADAIDVVQPMLWAVMVSVAELWRACGVVPDAVIGHSQGEFAAACVAGLLTLEDGARIVARRSQALTHLSGQGGMLSVGLSRAEVEPELSRWSDLSIAAVNSPDSVVISGDPDELAQLHVELTARNVRTRPVPTDCAGHSRHVDRIRETLAELVGSLTGRSGPIPLLSTVTAEWLPGERIDGEYVFRNMRQTVEFERATRSLLDQGYRYFIEVGPHPVLTTAIEETAAADDGQAVVIGTLRRGDGSLDRFLAAAAELHVRGGTVDWTRLLADGKQVDLPTYPFQRRRYWLAAGTEPAIGTVAGLDTEPTGHPILSARVRTPGSAQLSFVGRLRREDLPWLADHAALGTVILPGTAFVDMAVRAGHEVGLPFVEELVLEAPLLIPESGSVEIQLAVDAPDEHGRRPFTVHSRPEDGGARHGWLRHGTGVLGQVADGPAGPAPWPVHGAAPVDLARWYERMAASGLHYGSAFQGLRAVWRFGDEVLAEVSLPEEALPAEGFVIHPALFDATLHALTLIEELGSADGATVRLPFAWTGVNVRGVGATSLRARISRTGDGVRIQLSDATGVVVASVDGLVTRPVSTRQLAAERTGGDLPLFRLEWVPDPLPTSGQAGGVAFFDHPDAVASLLGQPVATLPSAVVVSCAGNRGGPDSAHRLLGAVLRLLRQWLADERTEASRLVLATSGAVAVAADTEVTDLAAASVWGLVRAAQQEHPGRFWLVDHDFEDGRPETAELLASGDAPQRAVRSGVARVPRLTRLIRHSAPAAAVTWASDRTLLITGGSGTLAGLVARHAVEEWGVRQLLLASRSGRIPPGVADLAASEGLTVTAFAGDLADPEVVRELLARIPAEHRLGGIVHAAAVLEDTVLTSLSEEQLHAVLRPKIDAAWNLHEQAGDLDLFALFSSVSGLMGNAGQANYAAANTWLDALATYRTARGLPTVSLAWGLWAERSDRTARLSARDEQRLARSGVLAMDTDEALLMLDLALTDRHPVLAPVRLAVTGQRGDDSYSLRHDLVRQDAGLGGPRRGEAGPTDGGPGGFARQLAGVPDADRFECTLDLVRSHAAAVLGHQGTGGIERDRGFLSAGMDSLMATELRNRLNAATGLRLPPTVVFDHPTPARLAEHLLSRIAATSAGPPAVGGGRSESAARSGLFEILDRLATALAVPELSGTARAEAGARLRSLASSCGEPVAASSEDDVDKATAEELLALIDEQLGS